MVCASTTTNPAPITVQANSVLHISSMSNAHYYQQVALSFSADMSSPIGTFSGSGEDVAMALQNGQKLLSVNTGSNSTLYAQFSYSASGQGGPFQNSVYVCSPVVMSSTAVTVTTVTSEDYTDNDQNDSILLIVDLS